MVSGSARIALTCAGSSSPTGGTVTGLGTNQTRPCQSRARCGLASASIACCTVRRVPSLHRRVGQVARPTARPARHPDGRALPAGRSTTGIGWRSHTAAGSAAGGGPADDRPAAGRSLVLDSPGRLPALAWQSSRRPSGRVVLARVGGLAGRRGRAVGVRVAAPAEGPIGSPACSASRSAAEAGLWFRGWLWFCGWGRLAGGGRGGGDDQGGGGGDLHVGEDQVDQRVGAGLGHGQLAGCRPGIGRPGSPSRPASTLTRRWAAPHPTSSTRPHPRGPPAPPGPPRSPAGVLVGVGRVGVGHQAGGDQPGAGLHPRAGQIA